MFTGLNRYQSLTFNKVIWSLRNKLTHTTSQLDVRYPTRMKQDRYKKRYAQKYLST
jgi:hypothetical protein